MNKKQVGSLLIGVGVLMALLVGALAYFQLKSAEEALTQVPTRRVVVATRDVPEQGRIELNSVALASISEEALPARPIQRVDEAVGKFARQKIYRGDILNEDRVVSLETIRREVSAGRPAPAPSLVLDRDQVMFVLPSRLTGSFAGQSANLLTAADALRPGDYVDVLVTTLEFPDGMTTEQREEARANRPWDFLRTRVMFQNLRVHNVGIFAGPDAKEQTASRADERYLTFIVDRETALQLKWLKDIIALGQANIDFVLRSPSNPDMFASEAMTVQDIRQRYGVYGRQ
jgi:Flp pilus assembly protein CpaB